MQPYFRGIYTAIVTPFQQDSSLDLNALERLIKLQLEAKVHGIVACGSTGEAMTLTDDEISQVVQTCQKHAQGITQIIAGAGDNVTLKACQKQKRMHNLGVAATLHVTPWYNKPTQEGLYRHYRAIVDAASTPVILYNVPGRTGVNLEVSTVLRLAKECPSIVGIKDANADAERLQLMLAGLIDLRGDFAVLSGEDGFLLPLLAMGGHGLISVMSNVAPKECVQLFDAFNTKDHAMAQKLANKLIHLVKLMFFKTNPIPVKTALHLMGLIENAFRLPLCPLEQNDYDYIKRELTKLGWL